MMQQSWNIWFIFGGPVIRRQSYNEYTTPLHAEQLATTYMLTLNFAKNLKVGRFLNDHIMTYNQHFWKLCGFMLW